MGSDENQASVIDEQEAIVEGAASNEGESLEEQYERYFGENASDDLGDEPDADADGPDEEDAEDASDASSEDADDGSAESDVETVEAEADAEADGLTETDPDARRKNRLIDEMLRLARSKGFASVEEMLAEENGETAEDVTRRLASEEMTLEEKAAEYDRMVGKTKASDAERKAREANAAGKAVHDRILSELRAEYPETAELKSLADLPDAARFRSLVVEKGLSAAEAYAVVTAKQTRAKAAKASEPSGKAHLVPDTRRNAAGKVNAPDDFLRAARDLYPDMSDAQIEKAYAKIK